MKIFYNPDSHPWYWSLAQLNFYSHDCNMQTKGWDDFLKEGKQDKDGKTFDWILNENNLR